MKFAAGLVLAALAVTTANAGHSSNLRSTKTDSIDASGSDDFDFSASDSLDASGSDDLLDDDDLTIDLTDLFGSDSSAGSHVKMSIMSLIGSGSDQVDLEDIIAAFEDDSDASDSGSDDLSWLLDSESDSGSDEIIVKSGKGKGKTALIEDSDSGSDDLSWLLDSDSESGSEDPVLVKGATKGKLTEDPVLVKGATKGKTALLDSDSDSGSDDLSWLLDSDSDSGSADEVLVKGGNKSPATKSSKSSKSTKATKTGETSSSIGSLYDDGSEGVIGDESASDEEDPILVKGATKGKTPLVEDDSDSASDESESASDADDHLQSDQSLTATKSSKTATKTSNSLW
ncbi:hypothetical protein PHYPSEUDO_006966 [Phytophthora pseudosyringae]|uniref:RxLR effector protein n=1 Tax=Phytophthora pseudosyringae TaxID=221518 RepID=A0A8T1VHD0_9STRA|nr:hypothetical protein PHYPSEUDO_006966 [Phytophthora pseudosyringae]